MKAEFFSGSPSGAPPMVWLDEVDSTNTFVRDHFSELADGVLVAARCQTAGRGRCGRRWLAPRGCCITATARLERIKAGFHAGCLVGLAALDTVREVLPDCAVYFKWPNDLYVGTCKLAGLLSEGVIRNGRVAGVAAGVGLNVNLSADELSGAGQPAVSLAVLAALSKPPVFPRFNVDFLTERLAEYLFRYYIIYQNCQDVVLGRWRSENRLIGREIEVVTPVGIVRRGVFERIDPDGALVLRYGREADATEVFHCGDVKIVVKDA